MKPHCLQLDAHLLEILDNPPFPAHTWTSDIITDNCVTFFLTLERLQWQEELLYTFSEDRLMAKD